MNRSLRDHIFRLENHGEFENLALAIFRYQAENNVIYNEYIKRISVNPLTVKTLSEIPFLPIGFFRKHRITTGSAKPVIVFESSGTTGDMTSRHYISDRGIYEESFITAFRCFYGEPADYFFAAILPSYSEKGNSSLVYMADRLIKESHDRRSNFFPDDSSALLKTLDIIKNEGGKAMLIGVSFALLDLAERHSPDLSGITVVETGGMKGRRKEITREELHSLLKRGFNISSVHSEYGMTELLSQAWSKGEGIFRTPPWMKILIRDAYDPLAIIDEPGRSGGINVIDLANINSCSFIATGDMGRMHEDGGFEVLGRFDDAGIRGCNSLI